MTHSINTYREVEFEIDFSNKRAGYGQWNIIAEIEISGMTRTSKVHTTDSLFIDGLSDLETTEEKQQLYFDRFYDEFEDIILEWINEDEIFVDLTKCDNDELNALCDFTGIDYATLNQSRKGKGSHELVLFENGKFDISENFESSMTEVDADEFIDHFANRH